MLIDPGEVLDHLAQGVIVTDPKAMPLVVNRAAREIVAEGDGLRLDPNGLGAERPQECAAVRWMIAAAAVAKNADVLPRTMSVSRPSMRRPLTLLIASKRSAHAGLHQSSSGAIVFISDPERASPVPSRLLQSAYGLTPMEAAVAIEIAHGDGLQSVAEKLGIGASTARTHLQHAFEKTGTRRQAQLAWLIAGSCGSLHLDRAFGR
jgi:DNA-binding CsgD family transcriptional regulator